MTTEALTEAASKKRGRPRKEFHGARTIFDTPDGRCDRSHINAAYLMRAMSILDGERDVEWLLKPDDVLAHGSRRSHRREILVELGRWADGECPRDIIIQWAQRVSKAKPRSKVAVAYLRSLRLGREAPPATSPLQRAWDKASPGERCAFVESNPEVRELVADYWRQGEP